jgi:fibronectin type 3 domain-containing protein
VDLTWNAASLATSYNIKRSIASGGPYSTIANVSGTSHADMAVTGGTTYHYVVSGVNSAGEGPNSAQASATPTAPPVPGTGTGLKGRYHNNIDFTSLKRTRTDATVDFNWGSGGPAPGVAADTFSVRWNGEVQPQFTQTYTFYTVTDEGVRLWVNGQLIIDKWFDQAASEWSGTIALIAGQRYLIQMEYYENGGQASAQLLWSSPSQTKQVIPRTQLYPGP